MQPQKVELLAKKVGLSYSAVYKWLWDRNQTVLKSKKAQASGLHLSGRVFMSRQIFKVSKVERHH